MTPPLDRRPATAVVVVADAVRRAADLVVAATVLVVGAPVIALVAIAVRVTHGSPVLFRQQRLGRDGRPFTMFKFRSMRDARPGREASEFDSERLTRLGRFLRASSLDELPGFVNVLRGEVGLVGPRPLPVPYWDRFVGDEYRRFEVRPGITGLAQVAGRNTVGWDERLALDVAYVSTRTLRGDLSILIRTVPMVLAAAGVNESGAAAGATMTELPRDRAAGRQP